MSEEERKLVEKNIVLEATLVEITPELMKKTILEQDKEIERLNNIKKKAINELFDLKDMIYKPETREINFDIQNKISSIIKILGSDKE